MKKERGIQKNEISGLATIPKRLELAERNELSDFPLNILFGTLIFQQGIPAIASALYEPDFDSFNSINGKKKLRYYNIVDKSWSIVISHKDGQWIATKLNKTKQVLTSSGTEWDNFFTQLTTRGLSNGEPFYFHNSSNNSLTSRQIKH